MQRNTLFAALVAAAFAFPLAASANDAAKQDKTASANDGGAAAMFKAMDKDGDGFLSKEEAKGTPHDADFASLDKNGDGKLSPEEHYNAKEHVAARAKAGKSAVNSVDSPTSKKTY